MAKEDNFNINNINDAHNSASVASYLIVKHNIIKK